MFRNTRKQQLKKRIAYLSMAAALLTLGIFLNYSTDDDNSNTQQAVQPIEIHEETQSNENDYETTIEDDETGTEETPETYLIKEVDGVVKVFLCDSNGNKELYLITSIPFDLLSESDQQLFIEGVTIETEDDLGAFLQNFDS